MAVYKKQGGVWTPAARVYVRDADIHKPSDEVWVKDAGVWKLAHQFDVTPPAQPDLTLTLVETDQNGRYIRVGVSLGGADPGLRRIRVLTTYNGKAPTTQYGGNYTSSPEDTSPLEPWSEFYFNGFGDVFRDPTTLQTKTWPRNATAGSNIATGTHFFAAWAEDNFGNWSSGAFNSIVVPRRAPAGGIAGTGTNAKEHRFNVTNTGVFSAGQFSYGRPTQAKAPVRRGLFFYGGEIADRIGRSGRASIKKAQIRLERRNDGGAARANVYMAHHNFGQPENFAANPSWGEVKRLGMINKGESKWFDIPVSWYNALEKDGLKGFILLQKDPDRNEAQANDFSIMNSKNDSIRTGELHVVWTEG